MDKSEVLQDELCYDAGGDEADSTADGDTKQDVT